MVTQTGNRLSLHSGTSPTTSKTGPCRGSEPAPGRNDQGTLLGALFRFPLRWRETDQPGGKPTSVIGQALVRLASNASVWPHSGPAPSPARFVDELANAELVRPGVTPLVGD